VSEQIKPLKVVYCYAHEDKLLRGQLENHLEALKRSGQIAPWHDREILPGADWAQEISTNLNTAHIILLLISPYFMSSNYCYGIEMQQALERHKDGNAWVIPVIMRPVEWKETPLGVLQALPDEGKPITLWRNRDEAFQDVVQGIRKIVEAFRDRKYERFLDYLTGLCCPKCSHGNAITTAVEGNRRFIWCMYCGSDLFVEDI
jgi:hypothetical protein